MLNKPALLKKFVKWLEKKNYSIHFVDVDGQRDAHYVDIDKLVDEFFEAGN